MNEKFLDLVCRIVGNDEPADADALYVVINDFVMPKILKPHYERKDRHISDDFMELMAKFGSYIYLEEPEKGEVLFELALQRISRGCVLHKRLREREILPIWAQDYSAANDVPAPMSVNCFLFLLERASYIMNNTSSALREHMKLILFGIINNLTKDGKELYGNTLGDKIWPPTLYMVAWDAIVDSCSKQEIAEELATPNGIIKYNTFFRAYWEKLEKNKLIKQLGIIGCFKKRKLKKMIFYNSPIYF